MSSIALADAMLAAALILWLDRLQRARGQDIPCTPRIFSWSVVWAGVAAMVGLVVVNVLALKAMDDAFGKKLSPGWFAVWLLAMSAASILFIVAVNTWHTNRTAEAWIRIVPEGLVIRAGGQERTVKLMPRSVVVTGVMEGMGGAMYVQYDVEGLALVVPFTRQAKTEGAPWIDHLSGLVVQGAARKLHEHFNALSPSGSTGVLSE